MAMDRNPNLCRVLQIFRMFPNFFPQNCLKNNLWKKKEVTSKRIWPCFVVYIIRCVISPRIPNWRCHWLMSKILWFDTISCLGLSYDNVVTAKVCTYNVHVWRTKVTLEGTYLLLHTTKSGTRLLHEGHF